MSTSTIDLFRNATDFASYPAGATIFQEGQPGDAMYAVKEGEVQIVANGQAIERIGPGGIFGEMALIDNHPRSASAIAITDCKVVPITQKRFMFLVQQTPFFAIQVMKIMSERVRNLMRHNAS